MNDWILMLLMVVLALFECMARIKIINKSPNHLITYDLMFCSKMSCHHSECLNYCSPSPILAAHGHGHGRGHGCHGGRAVTHTTCNLEKEAPPMEEQPLGDPPI